MKVKQIIGSITNDLAKKLIVGGVVAATGIAALGLDHTQKAPEAPATPMRESLGGTDQHQVKRVKAITEIVQPKKPEIDGLSN